MTALAAVSVAKVILRSENFFTATIRDITNERMSEFRLHRLAHIDSELELPNRLSWKAELDALLGPDSGGTEFTVVIVTVRNLDELIVTFGPAVEPQTLKAVHDRLIDRLPEREVTARISRSRLGYILPTDARSDPAGIVAGLSAVFRQGLRAGDFNVFPDVVAIVDWEMCTIGDPLQDLGWMLATWYRPGHEPVLPNELMSAGDLASPAELVERYAANTDRDLSRIDWYTVLACFKLGIILEGSHARATAGLAPKEIGDILHTATVRLFARATAIMNGDISD
jgi:GGDEF domain-containing protein